MDFAIIQTGGKQYKVSVGQKVKIEKVKAEKEESFVFDKVLLTAKGNSVQVGTPLVAGAKVEGKVLRQARERKKIVFRYHSKTRYRKLKGHRQHYSEIEIASI